MIDPFGGRADAEARILRAVHPSSFRDDPLRILRGVARRALDDLVPEPGTLALMREFAPAVSGLSAERVREQLDRTLEGARADDGLRLARDVGALAAAVPELEPIIGIEQRSRTQLYTLDEHVLHTLGEAATRGGGRLVRLAALWHDVGKPFAEGVRGHAEESARRAERGLRRLTYDNETIRAVCHLVREHSFGEDREPSALGARRFLCASAAAPPRTSSCCGARIARRAASRYPRPTRPGATSSSAWCASSGEPRSRWASSRSTAATCSSSATVRALRSGGRCATCSTRSSTTHPATSPASCASWRRALEGGSTCTSAST